MTLLAINYPLERRMVNGYGCYRIYQAVRLHFQRGSSFSLLKANRTSIKRETYDEKAGHRDIYEQTALRYNTHELFLMFAAAAASGKIGSYIGDVLDNGGSSFINDYQRILGNPSFHFENSAELVAASIINNDISLREFLRKEPFNDLFGLYISGEISPLILTMWNNLFNIVRGYDERDIVIGDYIHRLNSLAELVNIDKAALIKSFKEVWNSNNLL